jgi:hypothetical protein
MACVHMSRHDWLPGSWTEESAPAPKQEKPAKTRIICHCGPCCARRVARPLGEDADDWLYGRAPDCTSLTLEEWRPIAERIPIIEDTIERIEAWFKT